MTSKGSREHLCMAVVDRLVSVYMSPCSPTSFDVVIDMIREETQGVGVAHPSPNLEDLPFRRAKTLVQYTSAGQLTGRRIIGELLLLKTTSQTHMFAA